MPGNLLFEYAVIRLVPRVEREEFLNVGIILYCRDKKYLDLQYELNIAKLNAISGNTNIEEIEDYLKAFKHICAGSIETGPIGMLPVAERFRWLTSTRSTILQCSKVHPGLCNDVEEMLNQLYSKLVL
jgi:hypothetical protein